MKQPVNIESKILSYFELTPSEQRELDPIISVNPAYQRLFERARIIHRISSDVQALVDDDSDTARLARLILAQDMGFDGMPGQVRQKLAEIHNRMQEDSELRSRFEQMRARYLMLSSGTREDELFKRITGRPLRPDTGSAGLPHALRNIRPGRIAEQRPLMRWALVAMVLIPLLYAALYVAGYLQQHAMDRLAAQAEVPSENWSLTLRGSAEAAAHSSAETRYLLALEMLEESRMSWFGLFPASDREILAQTAGILEEAIEESEDQSFLQLEAYYVLAITRLKLHDAQGAQTALERVIHGDGRWAPEAAVLLERLESLEH